MSREAKIKLIAEGAARAQGDIRGTTRALTELRDAAFHFASDAAKAFNNFKPINFESSANEAKRFEEAVTRLTFRAGGNAQDLISKFKAIGEAIGTGADKVVEFSRAFTDRTQVALPTEAIQEVGKYANDSGRTLADMLGTTTVLFNKLNVPAAKFGATLRDIQQIAKDSRFAGGAVGLEQSIARSADLLAKVGGSAEQKAALMAELGRGKSPEVAQETAQRILSRITGAGAMEWDRMMMAETGRHAFAAGPGGRIVLKPEALPTLQKRLRSIAYEAGVTLFGNTPEGLQDLETFTRANLGRAARIAGQAERIGGLTDETKTVFRRKDMIPLKGLTQEALDRINRETALTPTEEGGFLGTSAGARAKVSAEEQNLRLKIGEVVAGQQDKAARTLSTGTRAAIGTLGEYLGPTAGRALEIGTAVGVGVLGTDKPKGQPAPQGPIDVRLDASSIKKITDAMRPSVTTPETKQSVKNRSQANQAGANY